jgi:hypothetical protein
VCGSGVGVKKPEKRASRSGPKNNSHQRWAATAAAAVSRNKEQQEAVKDGSFTTFETLLESQKKLSFEDFNSLPPDRNFGVIHQLATHGNRASLQAKIFYPDICDFGFLECSGLDSLGTASKQPTCRTPQTLQLENMPT